MKQIQFPPLIKPESFFEGFVDILSSSSHIDTCGSYVVANTEDWKGEIEQLRLGSQNISVIMSGTFTTEVDALITVNYTETYLRIYCQRTNKEKYSLFCDFHSPRISSIVTGENNFDSINEKSIKWQQSEGSQLELVLIMLHEDWLKENYAWSPSFDIVKMFDLPSILRTKNFEWKSELRQKSATLFSMISKRGDENCSEKSKILDSIIEIIIQDLFADYAIKIDKSYNIYFKSIELAEKALVADFKKAPPSLQALSKIAGLNRKKFQIVFKQRYQKTFYQHYQDKRFLHAKNLIQHRAYSVSDAAFAIGFKNVGHFIRLFKQYFDVTPSEFKKNTEQIKCIHYQ